MRILFTLVLLTSAVNAQTPDDPIAAIRQVIKQFNRALTLGRDAADELCADSKLWRLFGNVHRITRSSRWIASSMLL